MNKILTYVKVILIVVFFVLVAIYIDKGPLSMKDDPPVVQAVPSVEKTASNTINSVVHIKNETKMWQGSGFAVAPNIVATARHVVEGGMNFTVTLNDGKQYSSVDVMSSKKYDLGFILLDNANLSPVTLGCIDKCKLGQFVYAIGSPYGIDNKNSVTFGIISSLQRGVPHNRAVGTGWNVLFQTDAAGHPGNSGCPIFTLDGIVRGVLVAGQSNSLCFCIPSDVFIDDLDTIEELFEEHKFYFEDERILCDYVQELYGY